MASAKKSSLGILLLQIFLGLYLIICGIMAFQMVSQPQSITGFFQKAGSALSNSGSPLSCIYDIFDDADVAKVVVIILGACEALAGVFLILALALPLGKLEGTLFLITIIIWLAVMVFVNVISKGGLIHIASDNLYSAMSILSSLTLNLSVLAGLIVLKKK